MALDGGTKSAGSKPWARWLTAVQSGWWWRDPTQFRAFPFDSVQSCAVPQAGRVGTRLSPGQLRVSPTSVRRARTRGTGRKSESGDQPQPAAKREESTQSERPAIPGMRGCSHMNRSVAMNPTQTEGTAEATVAAETSRRNRPLGMPRRGNWWGNPWMLAAGAEERRTGLCRSVATNSPWRLVRIETGCYAATFPGGMDPPECKFPFGSQLSSHVFPPAHEVGEGPQVEALPQMWHAGSPPCSLQGLPSEADSLISLVPPP